MPKKKIDYHACIRILTTEHGLFFKKEFRFHPVRKWRFDFALPCCKLAIEVEGGSWVSGGHTRGSGFARDMEKYNSATVLGWRLLRFTPQQISNLDFLTTIRNFLYNNPCNHSANSLKFELT